MFLLNNIKIDIAEPITGPDGTQYPAGWFSEQEERARVGMVEVPDPVWPDPDKFIASENSDGSLNITARDPAEVASIIISRFESALTDHFQSTARSKRYDSYVTCAMRAGYPGPFRTEGAAFGEWMDACNVASYQIIADVQAGTRQPPASVDAFIAELPPMVWPTDSPGWLRALINKLVS